MTSPSQGGTGDAPVESISAVGLHDRPDTRSARDSFGRRSSRRWLPADRSSDRVFDAGPLRIAAEALTVATIAWALAAVLYRLWQAPLHRPVTYLNADMNQTEMTVKTIIQSGWILQQPRLGAPFGQVNYDFPQGGESMQYLAIKFLALFTSSPGLIINVYFFAGFGLIAALVHLILRHLRFGPLISAAVALPYAFLPFRLFHNEAHLSRTTYLSVPLACLLLLWLPSWRRRFLLDPTAADQVGWRNNLRWRRVLAALAICVFIGTWETMTTVFTVFLLAATALVGAIRWHEWRRLVVGAVGCLTIGVSFVLVSAPSLWYWHVHGKNHVAGNRIVAEAEMYGLKLNRLILPSDGSRLHFLQLIASHSQAYSPVLSEGGQSIGVLFTLGFFGALYAAVAGVRRARVAGGYDLRPAHDREAMRETLGMTTVIAILVATVGGFSTLLAMGGLAQVRTWNRISLFIAFFALLQVVIWFERAARWACERATWARPVTAATLVLVCALALADGPPISHPAYADIEAQSVSDRAIVQQIERVMPAGSSILQLPAVPYPEAQPPPPGMMQDYDPLRPFLADDAGALRWSYGRIEGRPEADWQARLTTDKDLIADLPPLLGMGFTGLWLDTYGFAKNSSFPARLQKALLEKPTVSPDGRFQFYDLRRYKAALGQSDAQLRQLAKVIFGVEPPR